ncbi:MAG: zinc-ribbon domain-containing protein [Minisyncoccia bacterium]|jgi:hypothetical protein
MALIKCSECGKDVSDKAHSCPNCGHPINPANNPLKIEPELTSKRWKRVKLIAWGMILVGFLILGASGGSWGSMNAGFSLGLSLVLIGIIVLIIGRIGAWYADKRTR